MRLLLIPIFCFGFLQGKSQEPKNQSAVAVKTFKNDTVLLDNKARFSKLNLYLRNKEYNEYIDEYARYYAVPEVRNGIVYGYDTYNLACVYASIGQLNQAIEKLEILSAKRNYLNIAAQALADKDFVKLREDKRWEGVKAKIESNFLLNNNHLSHPHLAFRLLVLQAADQTSIIDHTPEGKLRFELLNKQLVDSVDVIIKRYGYPTPKMVGNEASIVPALIIAHSDLRTLQRYEVLITREGAKGNIPEGFAGIVIDKLLVKQGKPQLYGTQGYFDSTLMESRPYPISDISDIEKRRKKMGFSIPYSQFQKYQEAIKN